MTDLQAELESLRSENARLRKLLRLTDAEAAPASVARILEKLLIHGRNEPFGRYDLIEHAPGILAIAYESGDEDAVAAANRVMDLLRRAGHVGIGAEVSARRQRE